MEDELDVSIETFPEHNEGPLILVTPVSDFIPEQEGFTPSSINLENLILVTPIDDTIHTDVGFGEGTPNIDTGVLFNENGRNRGQLIDELVAGGTRITPENVVDIRRLPDGRTVWLETGNAASGLQHIVSRHAREFGQWGVPESDIPDFVMQGLTRNNVIGSKNGTPVYLVGNVPTGIVTGKNGFIVTAFPVTNFNRN